MPPGAPCVQRTRPARRAPARSRSLRSAVEPDLEAFAVPHFVLLAFQPQPALLARLRLAPRFEKLLPQDGLRANETAGEVRVDLARRVHRGLPVAQRPRPHLVRTHREERD